MGIRPFRLAISGTAVALIACAGWFIGTDQRSEINRRAYAARNESVLAARAAQNHMSVEEMRRVAASACVPKGPFNPRESRDAIASRLSIEQCVTNYLYGSDMMHEPRLELFEQWAFAFIKISFISASAGVAVAVAWVTGVWGFRTWWLWLRGE